MMMKKLAVAVALLMPASARADTWIVGEVPAAVAVGGMQEQVFRPGTMPAVGVYHEHGPVAVGLRVRVGALANGPAPAEGVKDPGMGGLGTLGAAVRLARGPAWLEGVAGVGMTGADWVPVVEGGAGWTFAAHGIDVGPSVRVLRVVSRDPMDMLGSATLVLAGIDVRFGRDGARRPVVARVVPVVPARVVVVAEVPREAERDGDHIADADVGCAQDAEGCEVAAGVVVHDDRIVLDDRVLFDFDRARVRSKGRELVKSIADAWRAHPDWKRITVEGHADVRGSDEYNQELSQRRADHVKAQLVKNGFDASRVDAVGYGRARPRDAGDSEEAHHRNRRVEFVIDRQDAAAATEVQP